MDVWGKVCPEIIILSFGPEDIVRVVLAIMRAFRQVKCWTPEKVGQFLFHAKIIFQPGT
jgi:hypothetical protein